MANRFIIGVNRLSKDEERELITFLREKSIAWWHWIDHFWLLVDTSDQLKPADIRDAIGRIAPGTRNIVLQVHVDDDCSWAGFGPTGENKHMFNWIRKKWN